MPVTYDASTAHDNGKVSIRTELQLLEDGFSKVTVVPDDMSGILLESRAALLGLSYMKGVQPIEVHQYGFTLVLGDPMWWLIIKQQFLSLITYLGGSATVKPMGKRDFANSSVFLDHAVKRIPEFLNKNKVAIPTLEISLVQTVSILDSLGYKRDEESMLETNFGIAVLLHGRKSSSLTKKLETVFGDKILPTLFVTPRPGKTVEEEVDEVNYLGVEEDLVPILRALKSISIF